MTRTASHIGRSDRESRAHGIASRGARRRRRARLAHGRLCPRNSTVSPASRQAPARHPWPRSCSPGGEKRGAAPARRRRAPCCRRRIRFTSTPLGRRRCSKCPTPARQALLRDRLREGQARRAFVRRMRAAQRARRGAGSDRRLRNRCAPAIRRTARGARAARPAMRGANRTARARGRARAARFGAARDARRGRACGAADGTGAAQRCARWPAR